MLEYIIWGILYGKEDEELLYTKCKTKEEAEKIMAMFNNENDETKPWYGVSKVRLQVLDLTEVPDFTKVIL